jgi:cytochrome P450
MLIAPKLPDRTSHAAVELGADGHWHVYGYSEAREILRLDVTQAGFNAEQAMKMPGSLVRPVLFVDGEEHRLQRSQIGKYFSPQTTHGHHQPLMERWSDELIAEFQRTGHTDLCRLAARLAASVTAEIVGLTDSTRPGMAERLGRILHYRGDAGPSPAGIYHFIRIQAMLFSFWLFDVRPAIAVRRKQPRFDVISHLLSKKRGSIAIVAECVTYGAAGQTTAAELIPTVVWHCLRRPELGSIMSSHDRAARQRVIEEILRVEPVIRLLHRRAQRDLNVSNGGDTVTIPRGAMIVFHLTEINSDERVFGPDAREIRTDRDLDRNVPFSAMAFGSGPHKCAGEYVALLETDVFVHRLLAVPGLAVERAPTYTYNERIAGYELGGFEIQCVKRNA